MPLTRRLIGSFYTETPRPSRCLSVPAQCRYLPTIFAAVDPPRWPTEGDEIRGSRADGHAFANRLAHALTAAGRGEAGQQVIVSSNVNKAIRSGRP